MNRTLERAHQVLDMAKLLAVKEDKKGKTYYHSNRLEAIQFFPGYAEPGYSDPSSGVIAIGNWNPILETGSPNMKKDLIIRLDRIFTKLGIELEWSDEWSSCDDCAKLFRTSPDCMSWKPSFHLDLDAGSKLCLECFDEEQD